MIKPILVIVSCIILFVNPLSGQTYKQQFENLTTEQDTAGQRKLLEKWQRVDSNDAELYVAWFNYYVSKSQQEIITLGDAPEGEALQLMNTDTTVKEPAGYLYSEKQFVPELLQKGFEYADKGLKKHPARLDIRFGKIFMYGRMEEWEKFTVEIINTIDYSAKIKNKWLWTDNKPVDEPQKFMLGSIQEYQLQLYNTGDDGLVENMKRIAEAVLKHYPDHVESLTNLAIAYMLQMNYDKALEALLKAEKIAPKDDIVLSNAAHAYAMKGDKANAIKYYELVLKYGDIDAKEFAAEKIEELKK